MRCWDMAREVGRIKDSFGSWGRGRPKGFGGIMEARESRMVPMEPWDCRLARSWLKNSSRFSSTLKVSTAWGITGIEGSSLERSQTLICFSAI